MTVNGPEDGFLNDCGTYGPQPDFGPQIREQVPVEIIDCIAKMQSDLGDLLRAIMRQDDTYIIRDLNDLGMQRRILVNACQSWRPELRIGV
jgi:hypothetical protein